MTDDLALDVPIEDAADLPVDVPNGDVETADQNPPTPEAPE